MSGQPQHTNFLQRLRTLTPVWFFASYALCILIQFPVSAPFAMTLVFYALLVPSTVAYAVFTPASFKAVTNDLLVRAFLVLFAYIFLHAIFLTQDTKGMGKTLLNTAVTALFFLSSVVFYRDVDPKFLNRFWSWLSWVAGFSALASIILYYSAQELAERLVPIGRAHHEILSALSYGVVGIVSVYLARKAPNTRLRYAYILLMMVITVMILLTRSRMPIAAYLFCIMLACVMYWNSPRQRLILGGGALAVPLVVMLIPMSRIYCLDYLNYALQKKDGFRLELWQTAWGKIVEHPLVGNGMRALLDNDIAYSPHNIYIATAYYIGLPGALLFVLAILACVGKAVRLLFSKNDAWIMVSLIFFQGVLSALTEHGQLVKTPAPLWLIFWMPIAMVITERIKNKRIEN